MNKTNCNCNFCNKPLYKRPNIVEKGKPVYCDLKCFNKRLSKPDIKCGGCDNLIRHDRKFCSRVCSNRGRTGLKYGIGQPNNKALKLRSLRLRLIEKRGSKCNRCSFDKVEIIQVHHIIEQSKGGSDADENLELLCPNCHTWHHYVTNTKIE